MDEKTDPSPATTEQTPHPLMAFHKNVSQMSCSMYISGEERSFMFIYSDI